MALYEIAKFIHILAAACWAGGGVTLMVMTYMSRTKDGQDLIAAFRLQRHMGDRWFVPASLTTLLTGLVLAAQADLWREVWIMAALAGYAATATTGPLLLKPLIRKTLSRAGSSGPAEAGPAARAYLKAAGFDYTVIGIVIALMVFKPGVMDITLLAILATMFLAASVLFLVPALRYSTSGG